jgi:alkanesulfonate monooxygenase SsuD/methylene tetrahydromethanopterin reductase-like flavin-dependent oxidoreductase (luciferase family)
MVGLEGHLLNGVAFTLYDGQATWDHTGKVAGSSTPTPTPTPTPSPAPSNDLVWIEDSVPAGAALASEGGDSWNWISSNPTAFSGNLAHQSNLSGGIHQHYFFGTTETLTVNVGDTLIAYVYLDPVSPPTEIMLQWNDGSWNHRAYWGSNNIGFGVDGTDSRRFLGSLPSLGQWVRLEVPASSVGLEGHVVNGLAFTLYGGRATWDHAGKSLSSSPTPTPTPTPSPSPPQPGIWVEDNTPAGAGLAAEGGDSWNWIGSDPSPFAGNLSHQSNIASGFHQHYFFGATETLTINTGDTLIAYVYLDPANAPSEIMLQWNDGTWDHRAYWGANNIGFGADGTDSRRFMGSLPPLGQWLRLEVPANSVGLEGHVLNGMAFTLAGGRATWDHAGKAVP